jgi:hypothetical protein
MQYEDTFVDGPISRYETISGFEGENLFPINGNSITIQSVKRQYHSGNFNKTEKCNNLRYLVSSNSFDSTSINDLLNASTNVIVSETIQGENQNTFSGNFVFNRTSFNQKLYLIWDYNDRKPKAVNDNKQINAEQSTIIEVLNNDTNISNAVVTIVTHPTNGTASVDNNIISYSHNGNSATSDTIVYQVSNGICSSQATIDIKIKQPITFCNKKFVKSVYGQPNPGDYVILKIDPNDIDTWITWSYENYGQVIELNACVDFDTAEFDLRNRMHFEYDDSKNCCLKDDF